MEKKIFRISDVIVKIFFGIFILMYACGNILFSAYIDESVSNTVVFKNGLTIINIVLVIIFLFVFLYLIKKDFFGIKEKTAITIFLIICAVVGLGWMFINDPIIREAGDSFNCYNAANNISNGNYGSLSYASYISTYPNNIGLVTYLLLHIKVFGSYGALYSVRIFNIIFVIIGYYSLYKISDLTFKNNSKANMTTTLLMFLSMQFVFYSFMVYGNCVSYGLALLSVWFLLEFLNTNKISCLIVSSITIIGSISIKENSLIVLIAEIIFIVLNIIKTKKLLPLVLVVFMLLGMYCGTTGLQKFWGNKAEINYDDTRLPTICWLGYGLNYDQRKPGAYMSEFEAFHVENGFMAEYTTLQAKTFINGVLSEFSKKPSLMFRFYGQKFLISWADPQYDCFDGYRELHNNKFVNCMVGGTCNRFLMVIWDATSIIIGIGLIVILVKKMKNLELYQLLGAVIVIGGFLFHAFWEVKSIYLYQYFMYLLPYAAYGLVGLFDEK